MLVDACWEAARELEIPTVFTLTYVPGFFEKCGYARIDKAELPHKIWNECVRCPLFPSCQETALVRSSSSEPFGAAFGAAAGALVPLGALIRAAPSSDLRFRLKSQIQI